MQEFGNGEGGSVAISDGKRGGGELDRLCSALVPADEKEAIILIGSDSGVCLRCNFKEAEWLCGRQEFGDGGEGRKGRCRSTVLRQEGETRFSAVIRFKLESKVNEPVDFFGPSDGERAGDIRGLIVGRDGRLPSAVGTRPSKFSQEDRQMCIALGFEPFSKGDEVFAEFRFRRCSADIGVQIDKVEQFQESGGCERFEIADSDGVESRTSDQEVGIYGMYTATDCAEAIDKFGVGAAPVSEWFVVERQMPWQEAPGFCLQGNEGCGGICDASPVGSGHERRSLYSLAFWAERPSGEAE